MSDYSTRAKVGGVGKAIRGPMPLGNPYPCDSIRASGDECYLASGFQTVTVAPVAADLDFAGTYNGVRSQQLFLPRFVNNQGDTTINGYTMVKFTDSTFARGMPLKNLSHIWSFADPTDPGDSYWHKTENTCYAGLLYCEVNIKETGKMISLTRVNGVQHSDTVIIYCSDSMPVFNSDSVRQGLIAALDSSGGGVPLQLRLSRAERMFFILQDTTVPGSKPYVFIFPKQSDADACTVGWHPPHFNERPQGTKLLAWGHVHPIPVDSVVFCKDSLGNYETDPATGDPLLSTVQAGISGGDYNLTATRNSPDYQYYVGPINHFVITADGQVLIVRPGQLPKAVLNLRANNFRWSKGRCAWPRRIL
jgi:hypothetical protein